MIDLKILLGLKDFKDLDDIALVDIAEHASLEQYAQGERLVAEKMEALTLFLLEGEIDIQTTGGVQQSVQAGTDRAQAPVFMAAIPGHYARCTTPARILNIEKITLDKYGIKHQRGKDELDLGDFDTMLTGDSSLQLMNEITRLFQSKSITLPSIPDVVLYINSLLHQGGLNSKQLARVIQMDPMIAARVIQVANKSAQKDVQECGSIREAISKIGLEGVQTIVSAVVVRDLFMPSTEVVAKRFIDFYEHSIRTGVICYEFARHLKGFDKEHAFLLGVLHDIGVVPVLVVADKHTELAYKSSNLETVLRQLKSYIGSVMLQQWGFSEEYSETARHAYDWEWSHNNAKYCDLVQVALMHSHLLGGKKIEGPALYDLPAFKRLGLENINPAENVKLLKDMQQRVEELVSKICR